MTIYFTGDSHFGHWTTDDRNIIKYCNRPFDSIEEMDEALIVAWNEVVGLNDTVYHLGDFTLGDEGVAKRYFIRLNGRVYILGNRFHHDKRWLRANTIYWTKTDSVTILPPIHTMKIDDLFIVLCHFPFAIWPRRHYSAVHLHAHSHSNYQGEGKILDVGVDNVNRIWGAYRPVSLDEVREYTEEK